MSKMLMPIPVGSPILDAPNSFNITWQKYLKAIGDDLLTANRVMTSGNLSYTINANICASTYARSNATPETVKLPYPALLGFAIGSTVYPAGTKEVTFGALDSFVQFWYIVDFSR